MSDQEQKPTSFLQMILSMKADCRCPECRNHFTRLICAKFMRPQLNKEIRRMDKVPTQAEFNDLADGWIRSRNAKADRN